MGLIVQGIDTRSDGIKYDRRTPQDQSTDIIYCLANAA